MSKEKDNALTVAGQAAPPPSIYDDIGNPLEACVQLGEWLYRSKLGGCENEAQATVLAWSAMMQKKDPLEIAAKNHIIEGKLSKKADEMLAEFMERGGIVKWIKMEKNEVSAQFIKGDNDLTFSFTFAEAGEAGYTHGRNGIKTNWKNDPMAMLKARVVSRAIGVLDPRVKVGYYTPEEIVDMDNSLAPTPNSGATAFGSQPEQPRTVVDAEVEVVEEEQPPQAPTETQEQASKRMMDELMEAFATNITQVESYLKTAKWIQPDEGLPSLDPDHIERIYNNQSGFLAAVDKHIRESRKAK